jgi:hypothetical protein
VGSSFSDTVNGKRSQKSLYFEGDTHPTQVSVRKAIQLQVALANTENERSKIGVKFGVITTLYRSKHIPTLRKSTREKMRTCSGTLSSQSGQMNHS